MEWARKLLNSFWLKTVPTMCGSRVAYRLSCSTGWGRSNGLSGAKGSTNAPRPDLILLDLTLPKKDGRDILAELEDSPARKNIPVVMLTISAPRRISMGVISTMRTPTSPSLWTSRSS